MVEARPFRQVNVFSADPLGGNPLAVVHDAEGLSEAQMGALARWTKLSETTFLLAPSEPGLDYHVRIFTPGGKPRKAGLAVQQCGAGLAESAYVAAQGAALQRSGRVYLRKQGDQAWAGGDVIEVVRGEIRI